MQKLVFAYVIVVAGLPAPVTAQCDEWQSLGGGLGDSVNSLVSYHGEIVAGGLFHSSDGTHPNWIATWNDESSAWEPFGTGLNESVWALTIYNGDLIAGGWFT